MAARKIGAVLLFDDFETLDAFGPVEVLGSIPGLELKYWSLDRDDSKALHRSNGNREESRDEIDLKVQSVHGVKVSTEPIPEEVSDLFFVLLPGGRGTREKVDDNEFLCSIKRVTRSAEYILSVCTGSALLAAAGLLDGRRATSNNKAFEWVASQSEDVDWQPESRWVVDHTLYTSSGVSAGIDMSLAFVRDVFGLDQARDIAESIEYVWNSDSNFNPFRVE